MRYRNNRKTKNRIKRINVTLMDNVILNLEKYKIGNDREDQYYMYTEDSNNSPFVCTQLMTNKLYYILDILGEPKNTYGLQNGQTSSYKYGQ